MIENIQTSFDNYSLSIPENSPDNNNNNVSFSDLLQENLHKVNDLSKHADNLTADFALGKTDNIHQVTIATEKAQLALDLTTAIQNKVMDAYEEIMRIQV